MKINCACFLLIFLMAGAVGADPTTRQAVETATFFGWGLGAAVGSYEGLLAHQLADWKHTDTDTTAKLEGQCNVVSEFHLIGDNRLNGVLIAIHNEGARVWIVKPTEISVTFESGRERAAQYFGEVSDVEIQPHWRAEGVVPLPQKSDFKDQNSLTVNVPLYAEGNSGPKPDCVINAHMVRDPGVPHQTKTSVSVSSLEVGLGVGASLFRTNDLPGLGWTNGAMVDLMIAIYPGVSDGFILDLPFESYGGGYSNVFAPVTGTTTNNPNFMADFYALEYSHRFFLTEPSILTADLGVGGVSYSYNTASNNYSSSGDLAVVGRLSYDYRFKRVYTGFWTGDYFAGISLYDDYVPSGTIGSIGATGHSIGAMGRIKVGL